jgi:hypothetical protein
MADEDEKSRFDNPAKQFHYERALEELDKVKGAITSDELDKARMHRRTADEHIEQMDRIQKSDQHQ